MKNIIFFQILLLFISCNKFENKFYAELKDKSENSKNSNKQQIFDFTKIADFDWDYFQYIKGNESVPIFSEEIESELKLNFKTTDLDLNKTRFYFFKKGKLLQEIEINSPDFRTPYLTILNNCDGNDRIKYSESKFIISGAKESEIILYPNCKEKYNHNRYLREVYDFNFWAENISIDNEGKPQNFVTEKDLRLHDIRKSFDKEITTENDTINVNFKVINDCCQFPTSNLSIINNKILLKANFISRKVCDSYCIYQFSYKFPTKNINIEDLKIE